MLGAVTNKRESQTSAARARTLGRMKRLLFASTVVAACKKDDGATPVGGYAVVDPMPPPAGCAGTAAQAKATAVWKRVPIDGRFSADGGADAWAGWVLEMTITLPESAKADFSQVHSDSGYTKVLRTTTANATTGVYELGLQPSVEAAASFSMSVYVPVHCDVGAMPGAGNGILVAEVIVKRPGDPLEPPTLYDR
jgi:hypothetical protein